MTTRAERNTSREANGRALYERYAAIIGEHDANALEDHAILSDALTDLLHYACSVSGPMGNDEAGDCAREWCERAIANVEAERTGNANGEG